MLEIFMLSPNMSQREFFVNELSVIPRNYEIKEINIKKSIFFYFSLNLDFRFCVFYLENLRK